MRALIQRVKKAEIHIGGSLHSAIGPGMLVLLGIEADDSEADAAWLLQKTAGLRIFADGEGKMNLSLKDVRGELMLVSQFTLFASTAKGNRPSFTRAALPVTAIPLYHYFVHHIQQTLSSGVQTGIFGADMQVSLENDGPVTLMIDSRNRE